MKKYFLSAFIVFLLASCAQPPAKTGRPSKSEPSTVSTDSPEGSSSESAEIGIVPLTPKIKSFDWSVPMKPLVENMSQTKDLPNGSVLLVDTVKNNTNGLLQIEKATESLLHILSSNNTFFLISSQSTGGRPKPSTRESHRKITSAHVVRRLLWSRYLKDGVCALYGCQ